MTQDIYSASRKPLKTVEVYEPPKSQPFNEDKRLGKMRKLGYFAFVHLPGSLLVSGMVAGSPGSAAPQVAGAMILISLILFGALPLIAPPVARTLLSSGRARLAYAVAAVPFSVAIGPVVLFILWWAFLLVPVSVGWGR